MGWLGQTRRAATTAVLRCRVRGWRYWRRPRPGSQPETVRTFVDGASGTAAGTGRGSAARPGFLRPQWLAALDVHHHAARGGAARRRARFDMGVQAAGAPVGAGLRPARGAL